MSTKERIFHSAVQIPKRVDLEGDEFLIWEHDKTGKADWRRPTDSAVIAFSRLHREAADRIQAFAIRYGVLRAFQIKSEYTRETDIKFADGSAWRTMPMFEGKEPLIVWRSLSKQLHAALKINAALKGRSRNPLPTVLETAQDWRAIGVDGPPVEDVRDAQFLLYLFVNDWLRMGGVGLALGTPGWSVSSTDWRLEVSFQGLLGALAYRLLLMVVGESNLYACDGCSQPYVRVKRAPRPGQENFCDDCAEVAAQRASKRWKARQKENGQKV